ncbi:MAG TPA: pilus assembly protein MshO [Xanthomonadaceae bacterium]|jgi:MSHA biogenesis protein MshO|nr:pilus assembly protein MshO [Xanthomonadaceae bacterium]
MRTRHARGFTLVELVIVMVLVGILATVALQILRQPIDASADVQRRAKLADAADQAMARISRDLRLALPNSVRVSADGRAIEMLIAPMGGRYRARARAPTNPAGAGDVLDFAAPDTSFDLLAPLPQAPSAGQWAVVYNLAAEGSQANAWAGDNRATIASGSSVNRIVLAAGFRFPFASPGQRVYVVDRAVQYRCAADGRLLRHAGFAPTAAMVVPAPGAGALLAEGVTVCAFRYQPGTTSRQGLAALSLAISREGESVSLLKSVHLPNQP